MPSGFLVTRSKALVPFRERPHATMTTSNPYGFRDFTVIDIHTHVSHEGSLGREPITADRMIDWMDEHHIDQVVLLPEESPEGSMRIPTWWMFEQVKQYPDRFIPFCMVDPRFMVYGEDRVRDRIERYVQRGARGFGEVKVGVPVDDERMQVLYEACGEFDLPLLFHLDGKSMLDEVGLPGLERMVATYPDTDFIGHAQGWWAHLDPDVTQLDGYPEGPVSGDGRVDELLREYDNLYADISASSGYNALTRDPEYGQSFLERHHEKLLFGTDYLVHGKPVKQFDLLERFDLPRAAWEDIFHRNAKRLLRSAR